ncbi:MAG: hypothetical protein AAGE52_39650, partial [Myxococcota bacterium]
SERQWVGGGFGPIASAGDGTALNVFRSGGLKLRRIDRRSECSASSECATGFCVDGVCCNSACGGGDPTDCLACSRRNGAVEDGVCGPVRAAAVCRPSAGGCDVPERCDGTSTECGSDEVVPGSVCRPRWGNCDVEEYCDGIDSQCPDDAHMPYGTTCRAGEDTCTDWVCDGTTADCASYGNERLRFWQPSTSGRHDICRPSRGGCDPVENCGDMDVCPPDIAQPNGSPCEGGTCLAGECVPPGGLPNGHACRGDVVCASGHCVDDVCCDTACGEEANDCFACSVDAGAETDGVCGIARAGIVCRPRTADCDPTEVCEGTSGLCPPDEGCLENGTPCTRADRCATGACSDGVCCNRDCGSSTTDCRSCLGAETGSVDGACGAVTAGTVCRPSEGVCHSEGTCDGTSHACQIPSLVGTICRPGIGGCDFAELCEAGNPDCPPDELEPAGFVCRAQRDVCDHEEQCSGDSPDCPPDEGLADGTICGPGVCVDLRCTWRFDAGMPDGGLSDAAVDAATGTPDTGPRDVGPDAGLTDAGTSDAGTDAALPDAGPRARCDDGIQNGGESDIDCGGPCTPCDRGQRCVSFNDCRSELCNEGRCENRGSSCSAGGVPSGWLPFLVLLALARRKH